MIIDFWLCNIEYDADAVHDMDAQIAQSYKYLRFKVNSVFDHQLKFDVNTKSIVKQRQQRTYL